MTLYTTPFYLPPDTRLIAELPFASDPQGRSRDARVELVTLPPPPVDEPDPHAQTRVDLVREIAEHDEAQQQLAHKVRGLLARAGCIVAQDIVDRGCTGLHAAGLSLEEVVFIRTHLGGSGVGLPCYVPADRFCTLHNTIGGLQGGQAPRYPQFAERISRPLEPGEIAHKTLIERALRERGPGRKSRAMDMLTGYELPEDLRVDEGDAETTPLAVAAPSPSESESPALNVSVTEALAAAALARPAATPARHLDDALKLLALAVRYTRATGDEDPIDGALQSLKGAVVSEEARACLAFLMDAATKSMWTCPDHKAVEWGCRYCVAAEVVDRSLGVSLLLAPCQDGNRAVLDDVTVVEPDAVESTVAKLSEDGVDAVALFAKISVWRRRLARD